MDMKLDIKALCFWFIYNYKPSLQVKYKDNYKTDKVQVNTVTQCRRRGLGLTGEQSSLGGFWSRWRHRQTWLSSSYNHIKVTTEI